MSKTPRADALRAMREKRFEDARKALEEAERRTSKPRAAKKKKKMGRPPGDD